MIYYLFIIDEDMITFFHNMCVCVCVCVCAVGYRELVPLAEDLPQAPDIGGGEQSAFVIDSDNDDDLGMAAGEIVDSDENLVMDNLMREVHGDDANEAVAVELPGGDHNTRRRSGSRPELL
mmetsp:Transcript_7800/g.12384  ORF Transcript_7800/g.12384 Transcript_7800/m.12384 type:complete len:121 (+) Transcript_7800:1440-1802(+)